MLHKMRDGSTIDIADMDNQHLTNTIRILRRIAKEGVTVRYGGGGMFDEPWYDEDTYYDDEALEQLNFKEYMEEANKRGININV